MTFWHIDWVHFGHVDRKTSSFSCQFCSWDHCWAAASPTESWNRLWMVEEWRVGMDTEGRSPTQWQWQVKVYRDSLLKRLKKKHNPGASQYIGMATAAARWFEYNQLVNMACVIAGDVSVDISIDMLGRADMVGHPAARMLEMWNGERWGAQREVFWG